MRQCNEGNYKFVLEEYEHEEVTFFKLYLPKYMDTSLIKTEVYPDFISIVVKDKLT